VAQVGRISGPLLVANLERNGNNLAFRNTLDTTQLLFLDVVNGKIGVARNAPSVELHTQGDLRSTDFTSVSDAAIANFNITTNNINVNSGDINLNAGSAIVLSNLQTNNIKITDNTIHTLSDENIVFDPNGTGTVEIQANATVSGNVHATGNITSDGNLILGNDANDDVFFNADVTSNIIPAANNVYSLGTNTKRWKYLWSSLLNGESTVAGDVNVGTIAPLTLRQGNIFYVSTQGDDTNSGDHPQDPFKTIKAALDAADASSAGPITIHVFSGGYEEQTPLVVPSNVTIKGDDFRNTIVRPESANQSEDVFHLNGETTISNITIKDFYYDSGNDTGYAFRFAPNTVISTRSPYIQNVTVITQGTTTSASDPRGFASGDAGKGALIDGADVLSASNEASMLFHSATFITPGVDAITMTNGVRVEWLNSFTYFANRGLYAKNGATGHLSTDGSTVQYGAEIRSIGSASVYGNIGAEADGNDCIMYLIAHNFAYIGAGKFVDNDPSRAIQSQEVIEQNSGKIYHVSQDHGGDFRVGDQFFIDFDTGQTSLTLTAAQFDSLQSLTVATDGGETIITPSFIDVGNFRLSGNTIETLSGEMQVSADSTNEVKFLGDVQFPKNLSITGNLSVGRELITIGDTFGVDTVNFDADINSDVYPATSGYYNLGSNNNKWLSGYFSELNISDVRFVDTTITTNISNSNLEFIANGTGRIVPDSDVLGQQDMTVSGNTSLQNLTLSGNITPIGNFSISGTFSNTGDLSLTQNLSVPQQVQFENFNINDNTIQTTSSNSDFELIANGTGSIVFPNNNVLFDQSMEVKGTTTLSNLNIINTFNTDLSTGNIEIFDNVITTTESNSDLDLRYNGTGSVNLESIGFKRNQIKSNETDDSTTSTLNLNVNDSVELTSTDALVLPQGTNAERNNNKGDLRFNNQFNVFELYVDSTVGLGGIYSDNLDTRVIASATNNQLLFTTNNSLRASVDSDGVNANTFRVDDILIDENNIKTTESNSDLELRPYPEHTVSGDRYYQFTSTEVNQASAGANTGFYLQYDASPGPYTYTSSFDSSQTWGINFSELESGTKFGMPGRVVFNANDYVKIENDDIVIVFQYTGTATFGGTGRTFYRPFTLVYSSLDTYDLSGKTFTITRGSVHTTPGTVIVDDIKVDDNSIINTTNDSNTILSATGIGYWQFAGSGAVRLPAGTDAQRPSYTPEIGFSRVNTDSGELETWNGTEWQTAAGTFDNISVADMEEEALVQSLIYG